MIDPGVSVRIGSHEVAVSMPTSWVYGDLLVARLRVGEVYYSIVAALVLLGCLVLFGLGVARESQMGIMFLY